MPYEIPLRAGKTPLFCPMCNRRLRYVKNSLKNGYRIVWCPEHRESHGGYVYAHRRIMENIIGRPLEKGEHVHHINGNKLDNRARNLALMDAREHARAHAVKRKWFKAQNNPRYSGGLQKVRCTWCNSEYEVYIHRLQKTRFCSGSCRMKHSMSIRWAKG